MHTSERLQTLCQELGQIEAEIAPLQQERERLRSELSLLVEELGGKVTVEGFGRLEVSNASFVVSYDRKQIEAVILKLIDLGQYHVADAIRSCKKESARPGTLRIMCALPEVKP
jgi:regulator of replication initiation timing